MYPGVADSTHRATATVGAHERVRLDIANGTYRATATTFVHRLYLPTGAGTVTYQSSRCQFIDKRRWNVDRDLLLLTPHNSCPLDLFRPRDGNPACFHFGFWNLSSLSLGGWDYPQRYILWNRSYRRADALSRYARRCTWAGTEWRLADGCRNGRPGTPPMGLATSEQTVLGGWGYPQRYTLRKRSYRRT